MVEVHSCTKSARAGSRQRVLDFVGQPARHLAPGRHFLRANKWCDVVQDEHGAVVGTARAGEPRGSGGHGQLAPFAHERHLLRKGVGPGSCRLIQDRVDRPQVNPGEDINSGAANHRSIEVEQPERRGVHRPDPPRRIDRHHAGRHALENRFDVTPPRLHFLVITFEVEGRPFEAPAARREFGRH
jgi:hypothetical protein